jgi:hypothetical protein
LYCREGAIGLQLAEPVGKARVEVSLAEGLQLASRLAHHTLHIEG